MAAMSNSKSYSASCRTPNFCPISQRLVPSGLAVDRGLCVCLLVDQSKFRIRDGSDDETKPTVDFMFDKFTLEMTDIGVPQSTKHVLTIDKKGAYQLRVTGGPANVSKVSDHQLNQAEMTKLAELVSNTNGLKPPKDPRPVWRVDGPFPARYKLILEEDGKSVSIKQTDEGLLNPVLKPLIEFLKQQIRQQEQSGDGVVPGTDKPTSATTSDEKPKQVKGFMFDELTLDTTNPWLLSESYSIVVDNKGACQVGLKMDISAHAVLDVTKIGQPYISEFQLNLHEMTRLADLVSNTNDLNVADVDQQLRIADMTHYKLTLKRNGKTKTVECDAHLLNLTLKPLVSFLEQIHEQEMVLHDITAGAKDPAGALEWLNLKLDSALGRRKPLNPPRLALDYSRLVPRLKTLVKEGDARISDRAKRAISMIKQLGGDRNSDGAADQPLASFSKFRVSTQSRSPDRLAITVAADGWFGVWATTTRGTKADESLSHSHQGKLSPAQLKKLDQLVSATHHFRDKNDGADTPTDFESYVVSAVHESTRRESICLNGGEQPEAYAKLFQFIVPLIEKERTKLP